LPATDATARDAHPARLATLRTPSLPSPTVRLPRISPARYHQITGVTLVALVFIVVTGAAVRLTGSGLGCSQWPACENDRLVPAWGFHEWVEFGNRLITGAVSVAVILAVLGSLVREPRRRDLTWLSVGLVAGVAAQAVLGGISVHMDLAPPFISGHFLLSVVLLTNAAVLHHRAGEGAGRAVPVVGAATVRLSRVMVALAVGVLVAGTFVTGTGPHAGDERAPRYTFAALTDVTRVHSLLAWVFLAAAVAVLWRLTREGAPPAADRAARRLVAAIVLQGAIGYAQFAAKLPAYLVLAHVMGAVLVFLAALDVHLWLFARPADEPAPVPAARPADEPADGPLATIVRGGDAIGA
jgi:cytochrome c oxidase assembly protein subunit 15